MSVMLQQDLHRTCHIQDVIDLLLSFFTKIDNNPLTFKNITYLFYYDKLLKREYLNTSKALVTIYPREEKNKTIKKIYEIVDKKFNNVKIRYRSKTGIENDFWIYLVKNVRVFKKLTMEDDENKN